MASLLLVTSDSRGIPHLNTQTQAPAMLHACRKCDVVGLRMHGTTVYISAIAILAKENSNHELVVIWRNRFTNQQQRNRQNAVNAEADEGAVAEVVLVDVDDVQDVAALPNEERDEVVLRHPEIVTHPSLRLPDETQPDCRIRHCRELVDGKGILQVSDTEALNRMNLAAD
jgi:hypothetical protein